MQRVLCRDEAVLGGRVDQSTIFVRGNLGGVRQDVIRAFHRTSEENDAQSWPFPLLAAGAVVGD